METKLCVHLVARQDARSVSVLILFMVLFLLSGPNLVKGQGPVYLFGGNVILPCVSETSSEGERFTWNDQTGGVNIYAVDELNDNEKTFDARTNEKYDNFGIDNNYPDNVNLTITSLEVNDAGSYICIFENQATPAPHTVKVEAIPLSVSISCARSSSTDCPSPASSTPHSFSCTCIAIGAYPDSLQFDWSTGETGVQQPLINNTERAGSFDYYTNAEIVPTESPGSVTCTLNGYSKNWEGVRDAVYIFSPPVCVLESSCSKSGTMVSLTCTCTEASPTEGLVYSFFRDGGLLSSGDNSVFETAIEMGQEYTFGCRGCNGVNHGNSSNDTQTVMCQRSTTALPTTTITTVPLSTNEPTSTKATESTTEKSESTTTKKPDPPHFPTWAIILIIVVALGCCGGGGAVIICWCKPGEDDSKPSDDKPDDNGAGPAVVTEPPTYGKIDKNRTKDPTPAPRSSMRDSTNPSKPKQDGPMEMQYADLDHGNKPASDEVRKPKEEPTEYATVQSVIV